MNYVSCAPSNMYRNGAWYDDPVLLNEFTNGDAARHAPEIVAEVFPPYRYDRRPPLLLGGGTDELQHVEAVAHSTARDFVAGPATVLARATDCCVCRSVIYLIRDEMTYVVYETHRPNDRGVSVLRNKNEIRMVEDYKRYDPFVAYLWIGSAGSMNYGHWLVDDLPRLRAVTELRRLRPFAKIIILSPDCGTTHNTVHAQSAGAIATALEIDNIELIIVNREARLFYQELYFVTPVTHHPVLKSPEAMDFVATHLLSPLTDLVDVETAPKRLFVGRGWTGQRDLANQEEIGKLLSEHGFVTVTTEKMPVLEQARLFAGADLVVGCMGASMTNTIFCPRGAGIGYISPQGWIETFYWDLAETRRQSYVACYGLSTPQEAPAWKKNFRVNPHDVEQMLDLLQPNAKTEVAKSSRDFSEVRDPFNPFQT